MRPLILVILATALLTAAQPATLDLSVKQKSLLVALEQIAEQCEASLVVDADCSERLEQELTLVVEKAAWADVIGLLRNQHHLALQVDGTSLRVGDAEKAWRAGLVVRFYDIRPLLRGMAQYPGPDLDIPEPGGTGSRMLAPIADAAPPEIATFVELIQQLVDPQSWGRSGVLMEEFREYLAITQTPEAHARIQLLYDEWERVAARQIVTRVWRLDVKAAAGEAVVGAERWMTLIAERRPLAAFTALEGQQNHHFSAIQRLIVSDVDVVQKVLDPIANVVSEGLVVDCKSAVIVDGVLASISFTASSAKPPGEWTMTDDAGTALSTLDTPDLALDRSRDTRLVPFGGGTIFAFGERVYGVSFEVLQYHQGKPGEPRPAVPAGP